MNPLKREKYGRALPNDWSIHDYHGHIQRTGLEVSVNPGASNPSKELQLRSPHHQKKAKVRLGIVEEVLDHDCQR